MKFAREGARVAVCDINRASVDDTVATIVANGGEALGYTIDVTDKESIAKMVEGVMGAWGRMTRWSTTRASCRTRSSER
jgi:3-oxoacyl-[acyl-carrier protein] reductase